MVFDSSRMSVDTYDDDYSFSSSSTISEKPSTIIVDSSKFYPTIREHFYISTTELLTYVNKTCLISNKNINFELLSMKNYSFYQRFIELLPSITLNLFMKTSRYNYYNSLFNRGIECSELSPENNGFSHNKIDLITGKLCLSLQHVSLDFIPYLIHFNTLHIYVKENALNKMNFVKKYQRLIIHDNLLLNNQLVEYFKVFVHPDLEDIEVVFPSLDYRETDPRYPLTQDEFLIILELLNQCKNLKRFQFNFGLFPLSDNSSLTFIKTMIERFYKCHSSTLESCCINFCELFFVIHDGVLHMVTNSFEKEWILEKNYDPETILIDELDFDFI